MKVYPVEGMSRNELELKAEEILADFDPESLRRPKSINVEVLIDIYLQRRTGWSLDIQDSLPAGIEGYTDPKEKTLILPEEVLSALVKGDGRARFTGCHEFSHVVLHGHQMSERMVSMNQNTEYLYRSERFSLKPYEDPEWQANYLASALLMPLKGLKHLKSQLGRRLKPNDVVCAFKVSNSAAEVRLQKVGNSI